MQKVRDTMGESTDNSSESDESIEAQERFKEFDIGQDTDQSIGFANDQVRDNYFDAQNKMLASEFVKSNLPDVLDRQDFAREQDFLMLIPTLQV